MRHEAGLVAEARPTQRTLVGVAERRQSAVLVVVVRLRQSMSAGQLT